MIARVYGKKFKFCRLYEEDVFGKFNLRPKSNHKNLDIIYKDFMKKDVVFRQLKKKLNFFSYKLRSFIYKYYIRSHKKISIFFKKIKFFKSSLNGFFIILNKIVINIRLLLYLCKRLQNKNFVFLGVLNKKKKSNIKFNYRVDVGKPKREKKRVTLYGTRLLTRHRLRFFASRMTVRQFRSYVKKNRNSKYLGLMFVWLLETRIDTIFYRLNLQASSFQTRQYIKHFGVFVNDVFINIPSFRLNFLDYITIRHKKQMFDLLLFRFFKGLIFMSIPFYYETNFRIMTITLYMKPFIKMIFFPFSLHVQRLSGLGERF
jgi:ribosomal protein S4